MSAELNFNQLRQHFLEASCPSIAQEAKDETYANNILEVFSNRLPQISPEDSETIFLIEKALVVLPSSKLDTPEAQRLLTFLEKTGQFQNKTVINKLLRASVLSGNLSLANKMLSLGADPNAKEELDEAMSARDLYYDLDFNESWEEYPSLLDVALIRGYEDIAVTLIEHGVDVEGVTPALALASRKKLTKAALLLIDKVEDINETFDDLTALQHACILGNEELALELIKKADVNKGAPSPLVIACHLGLEKVAAALIKKGAKNSPVVRPPRDERYIIPDIVRTIEDDEYWSDEDEDDFSFQPNIPQQDDYKDDLDNLHKTNALFEAYEKELNNVVRLLIEKGDNVSEPNVDGKTLLQIACERNDRETISLILKNHSEDVEANTITKVMELLDLIHKSNEISKDHCNELLAHVSNVEELISYSTNYQETKPLLTLAKDPNNTGEIHAIIEKWINRKDLIKLLKFTTYFKTLEPFLYEYKEIIEFLNIRLPHEIKYKIDDWFEQDNRDELFEKALSFPLGKIYIILYGPPKVCEYLNIPQTWYHYIERFIQNPELLLDQSFLNEMIIDCLYLDEDDPNKPMITLLVYLGGDVNCKDEHDDTLLHKAIEHYSLPLFITLLKYGASLTAKNDLKQTPLDILKQNYPHFKSIPSDIEAETLIDILNLYESSKSQKQELNYETISKWANKDSCDTLFDLIKDINELKIYVELYQEVKPLLSLAEQGNVDQINDTIDGWKKSDDFLSILLFAFQFNALKPFLFEYLEVLELLDSYNKGNLTKTIDECLKKDNVHELFEKAFSFPLLKIYIIKEGSEKLYNFLNIPFIPKDRRTFSFDDPKYLLDQGTLNHFLLGAANSESAESTVAILIFLGADVNTVHSETGATPLIVACEDHASRRVIKDLIDAGANVNAKDDKGNTALHHALSSLNYVAAAELLKRGASLALENNERFKPSDLLKNKQLDLATIVLDTEDNTISEVLELLNLIEKDNTNAVEDKIKSWLSKPNKKDLFKFASDIPELNEMIIAYQIQHNDRFPEISITALYNQLPPYLKNKLFAIIPVSKRQELINNLTDQEKQVILSRQIFVVNSYSRQTDNYGDARAALETIDTRALPFTESERGAYYIDQITHILDQIGFIGIHLLYQEQEYRAILDRCIPYISGDQLNVITSLLSPNDWYRTCTNESNINRKMQLIQSSNPEQLNTLSKQEFIDAGYFKAKNELREIQNTLDSHITKKDFSKLVAEFKKRLNPDISQEDFREFITDLKTAIIPYADKEGLEKLIESRLKPDMSDEEYLKLTDEIFSHLNELSEEIYQKLESDFYKLNLNQYKINQDQIWKGVDVALERAEIDHPPNVELNEKITDAKKSIQSIHNQQKNLAARLEEIEKQFETEVPEEFFDALFDDKIMSDPVKIPGGYIVDRSTLFYGEDSPNIHARNPFINNQRLEPDQIVPLPDLKKRIDEWTKDQWDKDQKESS